MRVKGKPRLIIQHPTTYKTYKLEFQCVEDRDMIAEFFEENSIYKVVKYLNFSSKS